MKKIQLLWEERGDILVLTALLLPIMFGCLGIAYDLGNIYIHKARLQNVTDAAALAGGRAYLQSQLKTGESVHKDTYDSYTNGNVTDEEYVIGGSKTRSGYHPDADKAADDYIYKNIVNLGEKVYSDKFSHYALPGLKKNGEDYINAEKIFYRIGLYEIVPLHFLPVITKKKFETVRAGSVVVVEPGTVKPTEGGLRIDTDKYKSIFDNLITYSYKLEMRHTTQYDKGSDTYTVNASFDGDIVYTHMNNTMDEGDPQSGSFYQHTVNDGDQEDTQYTHLVYNTTTIDDPVINTFTNTQAYLTAFRKKLSEAHVDFHDSQKKLYLSGDGNIDVQCITPDYQLNGEGTYKKDGDVYYLISANGDFSTFNENGKTYKICYSKLSERYVLCGKSDSDTNYYLLNKNGNVTNCYIEVKVLDQWGNKSVTPLVEINGTTKYLGLSWDSVPKFMYGDNQYNTNNLLTINELEPKVELPVAITSDKFTEKPGPNFGTGTSNVYHVTPKLLPDPNGFELHIDTDMTYDENTDEPIYVIVDEGIADWKIYSTTSSNTKRPIIIVYLGNSRIDCYFTGEKFVGTIYAPNSYVEINTMCPRFEGNFIIKNMYFQPAANSKSSWKAVNHLTKDADVTKITNNFKKELKDAETAMNNLLQDTSSNSDLIDRLVSELGINKSDLGNMNYYMNLTLAQKKQLYIKWKKMYDEADDGEKNLLWPFNGLFTMIQSSSEGGETETTPETLRLINYRTEFQLKEDMGNDDVVDPFIFETLSKPNSY
jgi:hypothetical protein